MFYLKSPQWPGNAPNAYYLYNLGTRMEGKLGRPIFYHFMLNYQIGTVYAEGNGGGRDTKMDLRAYSYLIQLDYFINWQAIKNMGIQMISASGDKSRTPNQNETFMTLFPSDHLQSGAMDWFGLMNADIYTAYLTYALSATGHGMVEVHKFYLNSTGSAWYLSDQSVAWQGKNGVNWPTNNTSSKDGGFEIDLHFAWNFKPKLTFQFGYSLFLPGKLLKDEWLWNKNETVHWAYFQTRIDI